MRQCGLGGIGIDLDISDVCDDVDALDKTRWRPRLWRLDTLVGAEDKEEKDADSDANSEAESDADSDGVSVVPPCGV